MRILLVEANTDHQLSIRSFLKSTNHDMDVVETATLAVEAFKSRRYDLVLVYMGISNGAGDDVLRQMRDWEVHSGNSPIPIVAMVERGPGLGELAMTSGATVALPRYIDQKMFFDTLGTLRWQKADHVWTGGQTPEDKSKRIPIRVDPTLKPMIPVFLEKRQEDLAELKAALKAGDLNKINLIGHRLKGKGSGYGFPGISKVGDALAHAVTKKDTFSIREAIEEFQSYLSRIYIED